MDDFECWRGDPLKILKPLVTVSSPYCHGSKRQSPEVTRGRSRWVRPVPEKFLDFAKESRGFGLRLLRRQAFELAQQLALSFGQALRRLDHDLHVHVARLLGAQH